MVSYLVQSCMEKQFENQPSSSASCPFAAASSTSPSNANISLPLVIPQAVRRKIIRDVSKILHTLLLAGYETTAMSLSYAMYELAKNPRCQDRCCEEARRVLPPRQKVDDGSGGDSFGVPLFDADDDDVPYCRAVLLESIRLHMPVAFTTRVLTKDLTLDTDNDDDDQVTLLKGTRVFVNPEMLHRDERNFDNAGEFIPERWVHWDAGTGGWVDRDYKTSTPTTPPPSSISSKYTVEHVQADSVAAANPANFFSFSDGARNCVGRRLAVMESTLLIAELLRDLCVDVAEEDFELVKVLNFITILPARLPLRFWMR